MSAATSARTIIAALAVLVVGLTPAFAFDDDPATVERIDEADPSRAAILISEQLYGPDGAQHVVLARDDEFADSLAGTALLFGGPMLLTPTAQLTADVTAEIDRVLAPGGTVYLLGGAAAIGTEVQTSLSERGYSAVRLAGPSRVETSIAVADEVRRLRGIPFVLLARADAPATNPTAAWADSVSGGGVAAGGAPVVLTPSNTLHPATNNFLAHHSVNTVYLLGGEAALSAAVEQDVPGATRLAGATRDDTARLIAETFFPSATRYTIVNGFREDGWAFGLPAAGFANGRTAPILLADNTDRLPATTLQLAAPCETDAQAIGASTIISTAAASQLACMSGDPGTPPPGSGSNASHLCDVFSFAEHANLIGATSIVGENRQATNVSEESCIRQPMFPNQSTDGRALFDYLGDNARGAYDARSQGGQAVSGLGNAAYVRVENDNRRIEVGVLFGNDEFLLVEHFTFGSAPALPDAETFEGMARTILAERFQQ